MAYAQNFMLDDEKKKAEALAGGGVNTSGIIDANTAPGSAAGAAAPAPKIAGTGFVNLQQYLDTNKGSGAGLASAATADLSKNVDTFKANTDKTAQETAKAAASQAGDDKVGSITSGIQKDASSVYDDAANFLGKGYAGPDSGKVAGEINADAKRLAGDLKTADNSSTIQANLAKAYGKSATPYTQGFGLLDSFLTQGDQSGRDKLAEVKAKADTVASQGNLAAKQVQDAEKAARDKLEQNKQAVVSAARNTRGSLLNTADAKAKELNQSNAGLVEGSDASLLDGIRAGGIDEADLAALAALTNEQNPNFGGLTFKKGRVNPPVEVPGAGPNGQSSGNGTLGPMTDIANGIKGASDKAQPFIGAKPGDLRSNETLGNVVRESGNASNQASTIAAKGERAANSIAPKLFRFTPAGAAMEKAGRAVGASPSRDITQGLNQVTDAKEQAQKAANDAATKAAQKALEAKKAVEKKIIPKKIEVPKIKIKKPKW